MWLSLPGNNKIRILPISIPSAVIDTGESAQVTIITGHLLGNGGSDETLVIHVDGGDGIAMLSQVSEARPDFLNNGSEVLDGSETKPDSESRVLMMISTLAAVCPGFIRHDGLE